MTDEKRIFNTVADAAKFYRIQATWLEPQADKHDVWKASVETAEYLEAAESVLAEKLILGRDKERSDADNQRAVEKLATIRRETIEECAALCDSLADETMQDDGTTDEDGPYIFSDLKAHRFNGQCRCAGGIRALADPAAAPGKEMHG